MPKWLKEAVFYEIYPQSFQDSNGDGMGDLPGIIQRLDYIKELGCNAIWLNPVYDSPFKDGGYDVRDFTRVAKRYGTNEDLRRLFDEVHRRGMHILMDLIPGHTSEEHPWFLESAKADVNSLSGRYIWTDSWFHGIEGHPYIGGEQPRDGVYMLNFFKCQPALNYGWKKPVHPWQSAMHAPEALETRRAIKEIMRFWLSAGADGFRVDMADSLVKEDDADKSGTCEVWRDILGDIRREFPQAAFVSEWCNPQQALEGAGFDMDFYLDHQGNGYNTLLRDYETPGGDHSFFKCGSGGDIMRFLDDYLIRYKAAGKRYISFLTGNHDTPRASRTLSDRERKLAWAFLLTMPGVPFIYYGDEIGMRYLEGLPSKEGGYTRTGSRTPMQWDDSRNRGFSDVGTADLYLPVDSREDAPSVQQQAADPHSLLSVVKQVLALRHAEEDLQADGEFSVFYAEQGKYPFVYRRGGLLLAVNPSPEEECVEIDREREVLFRIGSAETVEDPENENGAVLKLDARSFVVLR